jgi:hypothetical protein
MQSAENTVNKIMDTVDELENFSEIGAPPSSHYCQYPEKA